MSGIIAERHAAPADARPARAHEPTRPLAEGAFWSLVVVAQLAWIGGLVYLGLRFL